MALRSSWVDAGDGVRYAVEAKGDAFQPICDVMANNHELVGEEQQPSDKGNLGDACRPGLELGCLEAREIHPAHATPAPPSVQSPELPWSPSFPKTCTKCGVVHSRGSWDGLELVGVQDSMEPDFDLELRNCECGSTITIRIDKQWSAQDEREWQAEAFDEARS